MVIAKVCNVLLRAASIYLLIGLVLDYVAPESHGGYLTMLSPFSEADLEAAGDFQYICYCENFHFHFHPFASHIIVLNRELPLGKTG